MESLRAQLSQQLTACGSPDTTTEILPAEIRNVVTAHWQQFVDNNPSFTFPGSLFPDQSDQLSPGLMDQLIHCWAGSDFAAQQCIRHPQWLASILENHDKLPDLARTHPERLQTALAAVENEQDLIKALRLYRNREMLRIIWLDLNRRVSMPETTADMSALADACIDSALNWLYQDSCQSMGTPYGTNIPGEEPVPQNMVVLGMGKLGARDLNLSSDIDLMFTYPCQGETRGSKKVITNQEFFIRLGQRLIKVLDCQSADGFVFRVDMRLRPYGSSGALAMCFAAMEQYYQDQGRDWERYAMLKARVVAGNMPEGELLLSQLRPFVYRRYIDFGSISALREMKQLIRREVKRKGMKSNIKLGPGGIREIEFIIQSFQLIHGGRDRSLQERNLLTVLSILQSKHYFSPDEANELKAAYTFLRNLEHAIQAIADRQTQDLPKNPKAQARVAFSMGQKDWSGLLDTLEDHRHRVTTHFDAVIADPETTNTKDNHSDQWQALWLGQLSEEEEQQLMAREGYNNVDASWQRLISLRDGKALTRVRRQSRDRLDKFIPLLLRVAANATEPDTFLLRILPLIEAVLRRTAYLVLLIENPAALEHLGKLCIASPWIAEQIARFPALLDEFLNLGDLYNPPEKEALADELRQQLAHIPEDDLENQMEVLRHFKMAHVLRVTAAQVSGTLPLMKESDYLTWIAEVILDAVLAIAWRNLVEKYGMPRDADGNLCDPGFIIVGYGKLGGIELGPGSDLDLVFIHNGGTNKETNGPRAIDSTTFYTRLGQRIIHILTTQTPSGILYDADMRLRPSGSKGLLVNSFTYFEKYQKEEAWTWEHQALVRARVITGDPTLAQKFADLRSAILSQQRDVNKLRDDVVDMRQKMREHLRTTSSSVNSGEVFHLKHDPGGIVDIEFLMQFAVLRYSSQYPSLLKWTDNVRISEELELAGLLKHDDAHQLREAYKTFRFSIHQKALQNEVPEVDNTSGNYLRQAVMTIWADCMT
ncbi:bifunctional [glutamate--ammonia ligase]-adenylyl-L-tyrosine phosphorylase/[glutamate--ammonia-ligase] adenylyltransferase [Endozoicomonas acroporae]|uniref:bifunctional [glutamate--ammonia ligase]-adenylyl-L-tyrosine phosphorylase/[glutamate--ammonia-ligase] adenylyltransferase n=1 Tax=Endozoicomonas acroporae TaxID=1701104 RepID=UPI000C77B181|nr:bifunctional [glutamate--ammonia ligase]-adenylyl-L-tyrosine phosphorylase/[glutamate--ammonia-ligase] adenylyltransferase [Endozoicomonas acroporae]